MCSFLQYILAALTFFSFVSINAEATNHWQNSSFRQRAQPAVFSTHAQIFITGFNLSSRPDANIVKDDLLDIDNESEIVENLFQFPFILHDSEREQSSSDPTYLGHHAGYVRLHNTKGNASLFYYYFEARQNASTAPVVVWLSGGPGCSGSLALFYENGPFKLTNDLSLVWNDFGWDKVANILYIDQPIGTGFSYSTNKSDLATTTEEAAVNFYDFLQTFFKKHPEIAKNDFYITGESYAGHYIPAFASRVHFCNKNQQGVHINLKGMAIGNGMTNPAVQTAAYPDYALKMKLITRPQYKDLQQPVKDCLKEVNNGCINGTRYNSTACAKAYLDCEDLVLGAIIDLNKGLNYYDVRKKCETSNLCYDFSNMERFLNQTSVKIALGVDPRIEFVSCRDAVQKAMYGDEMRNMDIYIPRLLEDGIKLLLYAGEYDLICNWLGNSKWVHKMKWSGHNGFKKSVYVPFKVDGVEAGLQKSYGNLTFLKVHDAGHLVPMDQPKPALEMLARWMQNSL